MDNNREAFEKWAKSKGFSIKRGRVFHDIYDQVAVNKMWESWLAGSKCYEPAVLDEISKRNHAEETIDLLLEIIGVGYEWSSSFGYKEAIDATSVRMKNIEQLLADWYEHGKLEDAKYHIAIRTAEILVSIKTPNTDFNLALTSQVKS